MNGQKSEALLQNLKDAGCEQKLIEQCAALESADKCDELLCALRSHRADLLESVHSEQNKLECIDYLIHKIKSEGRKE